MHGGCNQLHADPVQFVWLHEQRIERGRDMPVSIDFPQGRLEPRGPRIPRLRRKLIVFLVVIAAILFGGQDRPLLLGGPALVPLARLRRTSSGPRGGSSGASSRSSPSQPSSILYGAFLALKRASQASLPSARQIILGGQPVNLSIEPVLRIVGIVGSLVAAALTGDRDDGRSGPPWRSSGTRRTPPAASPIPSSARPLNFFLFTLPAWQLILGWLLTLAVILCVVAVVLIAIAGGFSLLDKRRGRPRRSALARALHHRRLPAAGGRDERVSSAASSACWTITPSSRASTTPTRM